MKRTGYRVWIFGDSFWHRTFAAALKRAQRAHNYCQNVQIVCVEDGHLVYGRPE